MHDRHGIACGVRFGKAVLGNGVDASDNENIDGGGRIRRKLSKGSVPRCGRNTFQITANRLRRFGSHGEKKIL